ncbi:MAG: ABC transporter substrate-binding protein [Deltaproteobacteria bacterium]|nr:ABC transporter substrate-binding protein [Deltaproteobacteria bacterium]
MVFFFNRCCAIYRPIFLSVIFSFLLGSVGTQEAMAAGRLKIAVLEEPRTLNTWLATDSWSRKVLGQIYQPLYIREPKTLKLIPWLAEKAPVYDPETTSYTISLRASRWSDGTAFTARDVAFTGNVIRNFKVPSYLSQWKFIRKIEALDEHTVRFFLKEPQAIFLSRTLTTPIVQEKKWAKIVDEIRHAEKPLTRLINYPIRNPVGTGPFVLKEWRDGAYLFLEKNPHFFARNRELAGLRMGPFIDSMVFKKYGTPDAAILAMRKGSADMFWWGIQPGYLEDLIGEKHLRIFSNQKSALYYLGFNLRKAPFDDIHFRKAVATMIDRNFIIRRILQGYAIRMPSIVPPGNRFWHLSEGPVYGKGLSREARIRKAYHILKDGGYTWKKPPVNRDGKVVQGQAMRRPDGKPMKRVTILTPPADYDPHRAMAGIMVQEWIKMLGIPAGVRPMSLSALIQQVKLRRRFDMFILGYGHLSLDPDYMRNFFHSANDRPRGWNMSGYRNPEFHRISDASAREMDREKRRILIRDMQRIIMRDIPYFPLYSPKLVEAVRTDQFEGWVPMLGGIGNIWSFCSLKPR